MNILLAYGYKKEAASTYIEEALRREHRVITCGPSLGRPQDIPCEPDAPLSRILSRLPSDFQPDLFMWIESPHPFLPRGVEELKCPTVFYQTAALWGHFWGTRYARNFDYVFVNSQRLDVFERAGNPRVFTLKNAADVAMRSEVNRDRPIDIAFLGNANTLLYPQRARLLTRLQALAHEHDLNLHFAYGLDRDRLHEVYGQAKIVFNAGFMGEGLNMRIFEAMVCGCLAFTDNGALPGVSAYFKHGEHLVLYEDDTFERLLLHYLSHPAELQALAIAGQEEVLARHSYPSRLQEIFDVVAQGMPERLAREAADRLLDEAASYYYLDLFPQALDRLIELEELAPHHPELPHARAVLLAAMGIPEAEEQFRVALAAHPSWLTAVCFAAWLTRQGRLAEALALVSDERLHGLSAWARTYYPHEWDRSRLDWLQIGLKDDQEDDRRRFAENQTLSLQVEEAIQHGEPLLALQHLQILAEGRPTDPLVWFRMGHAFSTLERFAEAVQAYERSLALDAFFLPSRVNLATTLVRQSESVPSLRRAIAVLEENLAVGDLMGRLILIKSNHPAMEASRDWLGEFTDRLAGMEREVELPDRRGFNFVLYDRDPERLSRAISAYLGAFDETSDVALHVLAGADAEQTQELVLGLLDELQLDPERIPDISLLDHPQELRDLPAYFRSADMVITSPAGAAQAQGLEVVVDPQPETLRLAVKRWSRDGVGLS